METKAITDQVLVGGQPNGDELQELASQGVAAVINLREANEDDDPTSSRDEALRVQQLGMTYVNSPVGLAQLDSFHLNTFRAKLNLLPKPVYVHCSNGQRATALALASLGITEQWTSEEALSRADEIGCDCHGPLRNFVAEQIAERNS